MPRSLTSGMQAAVAAQSGTIIHFIEVITSGGTIRLTTAPVDISWDSQTWSGVGGVLVFSPVTESSDGRQSGVEIEIAAVNQTVIAAILTNQFRGRSIKIWMGHIDSNGDVIADPLLLFGGFQNAGWRMSEQRDEEGGGGTASISTRAVPRIAELSQSSGIKCNITSHQHYFTDDTFFQNVPNIEGKPAHWGKPGSIPHIQPDIPGGIDGWRDHGEP